MSESKQQKSIYRHAADAGIWFGAYLLCMSLSFICSLRIPQLSLLIIPLFAGLPCLVWIFMRRVYKHSDGKCTLSALWMSGICLFIFGSLVCALGSAIYTMIFEPNFINAYINNAIQVIESGPLASEYELQTDIMRRAIEQHALPSTIQFIITMAWLTSFTGSLISLVMAALVKTYSNRTRNTIKI